MIYDLLKAILTYTIFAGTRALCTPPATLSWITSRPLRIYAEQRWCECNASEDCVLTCRAMLFAAAPGLNSQGDCASCRALRGDATLAGAPGEARAGDGGSLAGEGPRGLAWW